MTGPTIVRVDVDVVKHKLDAGGAPILVDVRRPEAYAASHIPGARSIVLRTLIDGTHGLPRDQEIVLY